MPPKLPFVSGRSTSPPSVSSPPPTLSHGERPNLPRVSSSIPTTSIPSMNNKNNNNNNSHHVNTWMMSRGMQWFTRGLKWMNTTLEKRPYIQTTCEWTQLRPLHLVFVILLIGVWIYKVFNILRFVLMLVSSVYPVIQAEIAIHNNRNEDCRYETRRWLVYFIVLHSFSWLGLIEIGESDPIFCILCLIFIATLLFLPRWTNWLYYGVVAFVFRFYNSSWVRRVRAATRERVDSFPPSVPHLLRAVGSNALSDSFSESTPPSDNNIPHHRRHGLNPESTTASRSPFHSPHHGGHGGKTPTESKQQTTTISKTIVDRNDDTDVRTAGGRGRGRGGGGALHPKSMSSYSSHHNPSSNLLHKSRHASSFQSPTSTSSSSSSSLSSSSSASSAFSPSSMTSSIIPPAPPPPQIKRHSGWVDSHSRPTRGENNRSMSRNDDDDDDGPDTGHDDGEIDDDNDDNDDNDGSEMDDDNKKDIINQEIIKTSHDGMRNRKDMTHGHPHSHSRTSTSSYVPTASPPKELATHHPKSEMSPHSIRSTSSDPVPISDHRLRVAHSPHIAVHSSPTTMSHHTPSTHHSRSAQHTRHPPLSGTHVVHSSPASFPTPPSTQTFSKVLSSPSTSTTKH